MPAMHAYMDEYRKVLIKLNTNFYQGRSDYFYITSNQGHYVELKVVSVDDHPNSRLYSLAIEEELSFGLEYTVHESHGLTAPLEMRLICQTKRFSDEFYYEGNDLGATFYPNKTNFVLWAPTASFVAVKLQLKTL